MEDAAACARFAAKGVVLAMLSNNSTHSLLVMSFTKRLKSGSRALFKALIFSSGRFKWRRICWQWISMALAIVGGLGAASLRSFSC